jgi:transposase
MGRGDLELLAALGKSRADEERHKTEPDYRRLHSELRRKGVTLLLLWTEYRQEHPEDGYGYSRFCELYEAWCEQQEIRLPQQHKAGERLFVDYAGDTIPIIDRSTGLVRVRPPTDRYHLMTVHERSDLQRLSDDGG